MKNSRLTKIQKANIILTSLVWLVAFFSCTTTMSASPGTYISEYYHFKSHTPTDKTTYVQMKDSSMVYGKKALYWEGLVAKHVVRLDGKPYPFEDVIAFQNQGDYFLKVSDKEFAKLVVKGRINVYQQFVTNPKGGGYDITYFKKENGPVKAISSFSEFKQMISDCKKASGMLNMELKEVGKIVRKQPYYIQTVIETYNNCGDWN